MVSGRGHATATAALHHTATASARLPNQLRTSTLAPGPCRQAYSLAVGARPACFFRTDDAATGVASFLEHGPGKATFSGR